MGWHESLQRICCIFYRRSVGRSKERRKKLKILWVGWHESLQRICCIFHRRSVGRSVGRSVSGQLVSRPGRFRRSREWRPKKKLKKILVGWSIGRSVGRLVGPKKEKKFKNKIFFMGGWHESLQRICFIFHRRSVGWSVGQSVSQLVGRSIGQSVSSIQRKKIKKI